MKDSTVQIEIDSSDLPETMRLFIGLPADEEVIQTIQAITDRLEKQGIEAKWSKPENLHITLAFLGEQNKDVCRTIEEILEEIPLKTIRMQPARLSLFRDSLVIRFETNPLLEDYATELRARLKEAEIRFDGKRFMAHVTLGRKVKGLPEESLSSFSTVLKDKELVFSQVALIRSTLTKTGPIYDALMHVEAAD